MRQTEFRREGLMDNPETDSTEVSWTDITWVEFEGREVTMSDLVVLGEDYTCSATDLRSEESAKVKQG